MGFLRDVFEEKMMKNLNIMVLMLLVMFIFLLFGVCGGLGFGDDGVEIFCDMDIEMFFILFVLL